MNIQERSCQRVGVIDWAFTMDISSSDFKVSSSYTLIPDDISENFERYYIT
jgi:hypothetical protein